MKSDQARPLPEPKFDAASVASFWERAPFCVFEIAKSGELEGVNPAGIQLLGIDDLVEFLGRPWLGLVAEGSVDGVWCSFQRAQRGETVELECVLSGPLGRVPTRSWLFPVGPDEGPSDRILCVSVDISHGQPTHNALRHSEQRYRQVFETTMAVKLILDPETGRVLEANEAACEFYGYTHDEFRSKYIGDINDLSPEEIHRAMARAREEGGCAFEFRHRLKNGDVRDVEVYSGPVDSPDGVRLYSIVHDITDRKRVERELEANRERFALAVHGSNDGIWDWDMRTGRVWWSPRLKELLGYADHELAASRETLYGMMHPNDERPIRALAKQHVRDGGRFELRYRLKAIAGDYRWFSVRGRVSLDEQGKPIRASGTLTDIHEEVEAQRETEERVARIAKQQACILSLASDSSMAQRGLLESCQRMTQLCSEVLDAGRCGILMLDSETGNLNSINLYIRARGEHDSGVYLLGEDLPRLFEELDKSRYLTSLNPAADPRFSEFPEGFFTDREIKSLIKVPIRRAGELAGLVVISETRSVREWKEDEISFAVDISERAAQLFNVIDARNAEKKQRELERQMLEAQKMESLGLMAGGVAHDFNNLLVVILGNADLLKSLVSPESPAAGLVDEIGAASQRAADLCQQMLAFSGRGKLSQDQFDLSTLVSEMGQLLRSTISKDAEIECQVKSALPLMEGDATQIRQIIMNLILNASEALAGGSGQILVNSDLRHVRADSVPCGVPVPKSGQYLSLVVEDDGIGMDEETLARLFDPFFSTKFTGRGLGMAAVLGIVRAHEGGIQVESKKGRGTRFEVWFPVAQAAPVAARPIPVKRPSWRGEGRVLFVDDDPNVLELGRRMLERIGFEVILASDGEQALAIFSERPSSIKLILLDLTMPGMGGHEVHAKIQGIDDRVPVIFSSGYTAQDVFDSVRPSQRCAFLQKPYTFDQLQTKLRQLLES